MIALVPPPMDPDGWPQLVFRWIHVVAGVLWIGLLYFFNWVNSAFAPTMDGETKKKVVPELMPRALFWFRWGAAYTFVTGVLLMGLLYVHATANFSLDVQTGAGRNEALMGMGIILVAFLVYDALAKALAKQPLVSLAIWGVLATAFACLLDHWGATQRAQFIFVGSLFGTAMAANVWMRIWPAQRRIITAVKAGSAPDPADVARAGLRSRHNTYMSVPLLLFMVSVHQTVMTGIASHHIKFVVAAVIAVGFLGAHLLFAKAPKVKGF